MKQVRNRINILNAGFIAAVVLYAMRLKVAVLLGTQTVVDILTVCPVLWLCAVTLANRGRRMPFMAVAFLLSAVGDMMGAKHLFLAQIVSFALAHVAFSVQFFRRFKRPDIKSGAVAVAIAAMCAGLGIYFASHITNPLERWFAVGYMVLITVMAVSAVLQDAPLRWWYAVAACIFIFSDSTIAWNRFMEHIPHAGIIIMSTYFAAQYLFARLYIKERN